MTKKKCEANHSGMRVRYCPKCGELINVNASTMKNCACFHDDRKNRKYKFCPDCGIEL